MTHYRWIFWAILLVIALLTLIVVCETRRTIPWWGVAGWLLVVISQIVMGMFEERGSERTMQQWKDRQKGGRNE